MEGIQFLYSESGDKTGVLINLKKYSKIWEDFYDVLLAENRKNEPRLSFDSVKKRLKDRGRLDDKL
jgi:hypothetical protein